MFPRFKVYRYQSYQKPEQNQGILVPQQPQNNLPVQNRRKMAEENPIFTKPTIYSGEKYDNVHEFVYRYEMTAEANCKTDGARKRFFSCYLTSYTLKWYNNFVRENADADFETLKREIKREFSSDNYTEELKINLENRLQGNDESPVQYLCVITVLCRKVYTYITDDEIIAYVTKDLKPAYFQALMYVESGNMNQFKAHLRKLESKFRTQQINARKHNAEDPLAETVNFTQDMHVPSKTLKNAKSVQFSDVPLITHAELVNVISEVINQKMNELKVDQRSHISQVRATTLLTRAIVTTHLLNQHLELILLSHNITLGGTIMTKNRYRNESPSPNSKYVREQSPRGYYERSQSPRRSRSYDRTRTHSPHSYDEKSSTSRTSYSANYGRHASRTPDRHNKNY